MGYTGQVVKSVSWLSGFRIFTRILAFGKTIVLARVLTPVQFGVFGIASLVLEFLEMLTETGINIFLIQQKDKFDEFIDSAWFVSILRGILVGLLIFIGSFFIADFFKTEAAIGIIQLISVVPVIRGFINPSIVKFQKDLQFNKEFWFRSSTFFVDALVAVSLALITKSVYSLAWGMIAGVTLEVILSFLFAKPSPNFIFHKGYFKKIFHSGKWVTIYGIFNYVAQQGDNIMVGKLLGASPLGIYQMAYKISTLPISEVTDVVSKVTFPVYSKISGDISRLKKAFIKSTAIVSISTASMGMVFFLFPEDVIKILLGNNWLSAAPVLQVLSVYGVLRAISGSASSLFLGVGKQRYVTIMTFFRFAGLALTIYPLMQAYGMIGAAYSALVSVIIEIPLIVLFISKTFK